MIKLGNKLEKIGVGIVTCTRKDMFEKLVASLKPCDGIIDRVVVFEDTIQDKTFESEFYSFGALDDWKCSHREVAAHGNVGVGAAKNECLRDLLYEGCDHIFTIEDDMLIKDPKVFEKYIHASKVSGIQHFNYGFSHHENLDASGGPLVKLCINYTPDVTINLTPNVLGAFTYYTSKVLKEIGLHDDYFSHNHMDHVELTLRAIKAGYHPPFWWFADMGSSLSYLGNQSNMGTDSIVRNEHEGLKHFRDACEFFKQKHGYIPMEYPQASEDEVKACLKSIKINYGL